MPSGKCAICNRPSSLICGGCKRLNYCGKDHQKIHWSQAHKSDCRLLYKLEVNAKLGRHLVAAKDIRKGETIFKEGPLVVGPKSVTVPACLGCHVPCDPKEYHECDGCGYPLCSAECRQSDHHRAECRVMSDAGFRAKIDLAPGKREISYFPIVPLRCLLLKETKPEKYERITRLQSHLDERLATPLYRAYDKNVADFVTKRLKMNSFDEKDVLTVAAILDTNAFEVRAEPCANIRGLYDVGSMLAHDCRPNTKHSFSHPEMAMVVSATRDIPAGCVISTTYTQTFWDTLSRRRHLEWAKCFRCDCRRCSDPTELGTYAGAIRCLPCAASDGNFRSGPYIIPTDPLDSDSPWKCRECGRETTSKQIRDGNETLKAELSRPGIATVSGLEGFLERHGVDASGILHPNNSHVIRVKHALVQMIGNRKGHLYSEITNDLLDRKLKYCRDILDFVDVVDPGFSRIRGEILNELQGTIVIRTKRGFDRGEITEESAKKNLTDALAILKEVAEIFKTESNAQDFEDRLLALRNELDNLSSESLAVPKRESKVERMHD